MNGLELVNALLRAAEEPEIGTPMGPCINRRILQSLASLQIHANVDGEEDQVVTSMRSAGLLDVPRLIATFGDITLEAS